MSLTRILAAPIFALSVMAAAAAPIVSLTTPSVGTTITPGANFTLAATASASPETITNVAFYAGATKLADDTSAPYSFNWTSIPAGSYSLTAVATDSLGAQTTSTAVMLAVESASFYLSENFDSIGTSGTTPPSGWSVKVATTGSSSTWTNLIPIPASGTDSVASMGASSGVLTVATTPSTTNNNGFNARNGGTSSNRTLATSPTTIAGVAIEWQATNLSGSGISSLYLGYDMLRINAPATANELPGYQVFYSLNNGSSWNNISALNPTIDGSGSTIAVPNSTGTTTVPPTAIALNGAWNAGANILLRWVDDNAGESSPNQILGLDNVILSASLLEREPYLQMANPTSMTIRWRTLLPSVGRVQFGLSPGALTDSVSESSSGTEHQVVLTGLAPNTTYFYNVGTPTAVLAGGDDSHTFTTPPVTGSAADTRIWILGDAGTTDSSQVAVRDAFYNWTGTRTPNLVLQLGDNAYNLGTDQEYTGAVFNIYSKMMRKTPFWSCLGNHDTGSSTNHVNTYPYFQLYSFPASGECGGVASGTEHYYSFNYGNIHCISLDSMTASRNVDNPATTGTNEDGPMAAWLRADLASNVATWTIAFWHHPPYSKGSHDSDVGGPGYDVHMGQMRENFLPILESYGVDVVLCGHSHSYERSYLLDGHYGLSSSLTPAMKKNAGNGQPGGTGAYTKPLLGRSRHGAVYAVPGSSGRISGGTLNHPAHYVSVNLLGSMVLDINGTTLDATFLRETGVVVDTFRIQKVPTAPTVTTQAATAVLSTTATLNASINPEGNATTAKFQYGTSISYGEEISIPLNPNDGVAAQSISLPVTGLQPATTYHFRATATSSAAGITPGTDFTFTTLSTTAEIEVRQNATILESGIGDVDFGSAAVGFQTTQRIFTVTNTGATNLTLGTPTVTGASSGEFSSTNPAISTLLPNASTTFTVTFTPSATGTRNAVLHLPSNDANESVFDINLTGIGSLGMPAISVQAPTGTNLTDGSSTVSFGTWDMGISSSPITFTVSNTGTDVLTNLGILIDGIHASDFTASPPGTTTLAVGASTTFTVVFAPTVGSARTAVLHLSRGADDTNPFDINLSGTGRLGRTITGTTVGKPTWRRPNQNGNSPPRSTSNSATATRYEAIKFTVGVSGNYTLISTATGGWDNYLVLYQTSFSPTAQLTNVRIANNNSPNVGTAGFTIALTAGTSYFAVTTGINNDSDGAYSLSIAGPGTIALTPLEMWRQSHFPNIVASQGNTADDADPDFDGLVNLIEYAFGLDPKVNSAHLLPSYQIVGGNIVYSFTQPANVSGVTYSAQTSNSLTNGSWTTLPDTGTGSTHIFSIPLATSGQQFMRLRVTNP